MSCESILCLICQNENQIAKTNEIIDLLSLISNHRCKLEGSCCWSNGGSHLKTLRILHANKFTAHYSTLFNVEVMGMLRAGWLNGDACLQFWLICLIVKSLGNHIWLASKQIVGGREKENS